MARQVSSRMWLTIPFLDRQGSWQPMKTNELACCDLCDGRYCTQSGGPVIACHINCLGATEMKYPERLLQATRHAFNCGPDEELRRREWISHDLVPRLQAYFAPFTLPDEMWWQIGQELLAEISVARAWSQWKPPRPHHVITRAAIWCHFVHFEGRRYISRLSNNADKVSPDGQRLLFCPTHETKSVRFVLTRENHLGITDMLFLDRDAQVPCKEQEADMWWRITRLDDGATTLETKSDVGAL